MNSKLIRLLALLAVLNACTPTRVEPQVSLPIINDWQHKPTVAVPLDRDALASWWKGFQDPTLDLLISDALAANHDLRIAGARVREVQSAVTVAESALYPTIDFSVSGGREKRIDRIIAAPTPQGIGLITPTGNLVSVGLSARWEIDVFGGRHLEAEAAAAQATVSLEAKRAVLVGLLAQVATHYLELRGLQARTHVLEDNITLQQERLRVVRALAQAGLAREGDVARQQTQLLSTQASLPALVGATDTLIHRLGVLTGKPPNHFRALLAKAAKLPERLPLLPSLIPAALLEQRPDLRLAKTEVSAAAASLGAAKADLFPKLVISTSGGFGTLAVGGFTSLAEGVYALGSGLSAPIFNAGRIRAQITAADARLDQAATRYEKTFLTALEDVENAYVQHNSAAKRLAELLQAEVKSDQARRDADALYQYGDADLLSALDAQRVKLEVSDERIKAETDVAVGMVSLYRALGGGWRDETAVGLASRSTVTP
ncbi:MAG: TolC family protein [Methylococcales bacterium]|nr:TolC family protein [Methylococcales bacterium]